MRAAVTGPATRPVKHTPAPLALLPVVAGALAAGEPATPITAAPSASATATPSAPSPAPAPTTESGETPPPGEQPAEPPSIPHVQVTAVEYSYSLSRTTVPAGKVVLQFVNNGQDEHNLNIEPLGGPLTGSFANTPSKGVGDLQLEMHPGSYTLFCSLPTHEAKGMKATLVVE